MVAAGVSQDKMQAIFDEDTSHPDFCTTTIAFLNAVAVMGGSAGEAVRFEAMQAMLTFAP